MSEETLLSAARRVCRFFNIDMNKGGIITVETQQAVHTLEQQIELIRLRLDKATKAAMAKEDADDARR